MLYKSTTVLLALLGTTNATDAAANDVVWKAEQKCVGTMFAAGGDLFAKATADGAALTDNAGCKAACLAFSAVAEN